MDIFSVIIFLIYVSIILIIMIYISPVVSALVLILVPVVSVFLLPEGTKSFFSIEQFSFAGVSIQNIHILLSIWSALIGIVVYTEIISWYLLRTEKPAPKKPEVPVKPIPPKPEETKKSIRTKVEEFLLKLGKIMSGRK